MAHKTLLPTEILEQIFEGLSTDDLFTCQAVCHAWHVPAKRDFYKHVEFKTSISINLFLTCISPKPTTTMSATTVTTIPPPGPFVKRLFFNQPPTTSNMLHFSVGSTLSSNHILALAKQCPNVTSVDCTQNLSSVVVSGLLSLDDSVAWRHLLSFPDTRISQELYRQCSYKFRRSLSTLYFDMGVEDLSYLREFPCLNILDLSTAPISCIDELESILNSCVYLTQLTLNLKRVHPPSKNLLFSSSTATTTTTTAYPSLKLLKLITEDDDFDHAFLKYMIKKFNRLLSVEICGVDLLDVSLKNKPEYLRITQWINSMKSSELVLLGRDYNMVPQVATEYLSGLFETQLSTVRYNTTLNIHNTNHEMTNRNSTTFLVFSSMSVNPMCIQRDIDIQLPEFETSNRLVHSNYINQFASHVNEIFISYEGTPIYTRGCSYFLDSIIEQCSVLRSISVNYCDLSLSMNVINETITEFSISNSQISQDFFQALSYCCPSLKHLTLHRNFHSRGEEHAIFISMPHSDLEALSLLGEVSFPWMSAQGGNNSNIPNWLIKICTSENNRERYFKIDTMTSTCTEIFDKEQRRSRVIRRAGSTTHVSIGINCKSLKKFRMSIAFTEIALDL